MKERRGNEDARSWPVLGCGVGLRPKHYPAITGDWPKMDFFEAVTENFMDSGGRPLAILESVRAHYPVALHGVSLSIGSADPLRPDYLKKLKVLAERIDPFIVSDHLCWSSVDGEELHDLLPLPFTEEAIAHVAGRIRKVQDFIGRRILIENVSAYLTYRHSAMPEWEFLTEIARRSGCGILLDLNNIYVNAVNHNFDPLDYLKGVPAPLVGQFHLGGHTSMGTFLFDTHGSEIIDPVWRLYREALALYGPVSTLVEWDEDIPSFERLAEEAEKARVIYREYASPNRACPAGTLGPSPGLAMLSHGFPSENRLENALGPTRSGDKVPLVEIQREFASRLLPGHEPAGSRLPLNPQGGVPGEERIAVYAGGYVARMHEALAEVYEAVQSAIGGKFFDLAALYAARYPSKHYNLNWAGRHFARFLEIEIGGDFPFLPDLARLEWIIAEAFHSFDGAPFDRSALSRIPVDDWAEAKITFQPSVQVLSSDWPVLDLWRARREAPGESGVKPEKRPQHVLVFRQGLDVRCELVMPVQQRLLQGLQSGRKLGELCDELLEDADDLPVGDWFAAWAQTGLILRCDIAARAR